MRSKSGRAPGRRSIKRVFLIGTVVILVLSLFSFCASAFVFNMVFRRQAENPYALTMVYSAQDAAAYPRAQLSFPSGENTLNGYLYGSGSEQGVIIIVNGFHATQTGHLAEVFYFVDAGWSVLTFDGTGVGESEGSSLIGLEQGRRDVLAALDFVSTYPDTAGLPLFLYGHSAGGYAVATLCDDARVSASVSISGFNSPRRMMHHYAKKYVGILADIEYPFMCLYDSFLFGRDGRITAEKQLSGARHPVMIVQGSEDQVVPLPQSIYASCDDLDNGNIHRLLLEEDFRNEHSTIWLSPEAADELLRLSQYESDSLSRYGDSVPENVEARLTQNAARSDLLLRDLDPAFMAEVDAFFSQALTN